MTRNELNEGIARILIQATLPEAWDEPNCCPDPSSDAAYAAWVKAVSDYIYEFAIRFKQKGLKYERAMELASKAAIRKDVEERYQHIMSIKLPGEEGYGEKESGRVSGQIRMRADGPRHCPYCGLDSGGDRRQDRGGREEGSA